MKQIDVNNAVSLMGSIFTSISPTLTLYSRLLLTWGLGLSEDNMSFYTSPLICSRLC